MTTPPIQAGQYLYASCSAEDYGKILSIGADANGVPCMDIEVFHPDDLISCSETEYAGWGNPLTTLEVPVGGVKLILRNVQWVPVESTDGVARVRCNTPGNNCFRCTKLFWVHEKPTEDIQESEGFRP